MPRRLPNPGAQQMAFTGLPGDGARGRGGPRLPSLPLPQLREVSGAGGPDSWRASGVGGGGGGGGWWPSGSSYPEMGVGVRSPSPRLPALPTVAQRAAQNRTTLRSLLLPPLLLARAPREPAPPRARPGESEDPWRGAAREARDSLRGLLGELLPGRFGEFLHQRRAERAGPPPASSASRPKRSVSEHCHNSPQCPHCSFLPDLRGQSSYFQDSLKKILLHQIPVPGTLRKDHSQFTLKKGNHRSHNIQAPKLKTVLTHSSSGEGSGRCRRFCPFRVRFADETLQDTALRYWERNCAVRQSNIENGIATRSSTSERVSGSVGRWLESLPKALSPRAQEEAMASISLFCWECPGLPTQEPQSHLSEDAFMNSLPFIPSASTQSQQGDLKTLLDTDHILEPVGKSPCSWSQKLESFLPSLVLHTVLKQGRPKGYRLLLPSTKSQQAPGAAVGPRPAARCRAAPRPRGGSVGLALAPPGAAETSQPPAPGRKLFPSRRARVSRPRPPPAAGPRRAAFHLPRVRRWPGPPFSHCFLLLLSQKVLGLQRRCGRRGCKSRPA
uniref:uncharacterized protein C9orf50 homolog n=1 Tax=Nyctereutes procyonoides TaxID=34880 RepID=UPI0024448C7E|nr:uncharacterized protein C9orf50 homolog [Nyctereutes procyonoides]